MAVVSNKYQDTTDCLALWIVLQSLFYLISSWMLQAANILACCLTFIILADDDPLHTNAAGVAMLDVGRYEAQREYHMILLKMLRESLCWQHWQ
jgi:hypothetical protein